MIAGHTAVLVCGSRPNTGRREERAKWHDFPKRLNDVLDYRLVRGRFLLISGMAAGPDDWAWFWAERRGLCRLAMPADWQQGKQAGFIRNAQMVELADECIAVWDGKSKGTAHTIELCRKKGIPVHILEVAA